MKDTSDFSAKAWFSAIVTPSVSAIKACQSSVVEICHFKASASTPMTLVINAMIPQIHANAFAQFQIDGIRDFLVVSLMFNDETKRELFPKKRKNYIFSPLDLTESANDLSLLQSKKKTSS